nr:hypothetical protein [Raoultella terrigena]
MGSIDYCEGDSGKNIRSCNVALLIRVHGDFVMGSGIEGIYPLPSVKNGGLMNTSFHPGYWGESDGTGNKVNGDAKGQL